MFLRVRSTLFSIDKYCDSRVLGMVSLGVVGMGGSAVSPAEIQFGAARLTVGMSIPSRPV